MPEILVVVPTYNEIENLERTVGRIRQTLPHADVLIVDDASPDGTGELADRLAAADSGIRVLHRTTRGYASAILEGFRIAIELGADRVVTTDADGSFDASALPELVKASASGVDLVIGSRWVPGGDVRNMRLRRRVLSRAGNFYARTLLQSGILDLTSTNRVYRTSILARLHPDRITSDAYAFTIELVVRIAKLGGSIVEVPVEFTERAVGASKMRFGELTGALGRVTRWGVRGVRAKPRGASRS